MPTWMPDFEDEDTATLETPATAPRPPQDALRPPKGPRARPAPQSAPKGPPRPGNEPSKADRRAAADLDAYFRSTKPPTPPTLASGDEVGWARYFLLATGEPATGGRWFERGTVVGISETGLVRVRWGNGSEFYSAASNLARPGPNRGWCD